MFQKWNEHDKYFDHIYPMLQWIPKCAGIPAPHSVNKRKWKSITTFNCKKFQWHTIFWILRPKFTQRCKISFHHSRTRNQERRNDYLISPPRSVIQIWFQRIWYNERTVTKNVLSSWSMHFKKYLWVWCIKFSSLLHWILC